MKSFFTGEKNAKCTACSKRVLLVEDNELNREIASAILEETGMVIDYAEDGRLIARVLDQIFKKVG